ncbi:general odorant-binding protein 67 [Scaptodrosophila lebanonensis]|uniref:General odorant-binding protein 67 n=1 Tax=Drosophila lebanonensis TaxID=7225 RepID=A0A6J2UGX8_DROLE|nr:general odorant-binding protein 67 [Scaptodrosophila lebanonensis]
MLSKSQLLLLVVGLCLSVASADVDCSKRPKRMDPKKCCAIPEFVTDELKEKCKEYNTTSSVEKTDDSSSSIENKHHRHHHHHHHLPPCFYSCVFNETGIFVDNKLNDEKLQGYLKTVFASSTELQTTVSESFTTCAAKNAEFMAKMGDRTRPSPPPGAPICPHNAGHLMGCVFKTTFKNCPASIWSDTEPCNELRDHFNNCKRPNGPGPSNEEA